MVGLRLLVRSSTAMHEVNSIIFSNSDYQGAKAAGFNALLIRRLGPLGEEEHKDTDENLQDVQCIGSLHEIPQQLLKHTERKR
jgi:hypothetical protein